MGGSTPQSTGNSRYLTKALATLLWAWGQGRLERGLIFPMLLSYLHYLNLKGTHCRREIWEMVALRTKSGSRVLCLETNKGEEGAGNQKFHVVNQTLRVLVSHS